MVDNENPMNSYVMSQFFSENFAGSRLHAELCSCAQSDGIDSQMMLRIIRESKSRLS